MYVVSVAPIKRGIPIEELSYFTKEPIEAGTLVSVSLRGHSVPALVISSIPAADAKTEIKRSEFALKRLERVRKANFFRPEFVRAAQKTAAYFAASTGATLQSVFPNALLAAKNDGKVHASVKRVTRRPGEHYILQAEEEERLATYKSHIREVFARGASCYFILPSIQEIERAHETLEKGIENYTYILHSGLTKKEVEKRWTEILANEHPVLIIGTPLFLSIPRHDLESVILDKESSSAYQMNAGSRSGR